MGLERFTDPDAMVKFYTADPKHFFYTLGVLTLP